METIIKLGLIGSVAYILAAAAGFVPWGVFDLLPKLINAVLG